MKPIKLTVKGINSFVEAQTIDFKTLSEKGIFGIFGQTGSGKSTILDCIFLALYGKIIRTKKPCEFVNLQGDNGSVCLEFEVVENGKAKSYVANREFIVNRNTNETSEKATLFEIMPEGEKKKIAGDVLTCNKKCEEIIGFGSEEFKRCIALPQGEYAKLLKDSGYEKLQTLAKIFDLEKYGAKLFNTLSKQIDEKEVRLAYINGAINELSISTLTSEKYSKQELRASEIESEICAKKFAQVRNEILQKQKTDLILNQENELTNKLTTLKAQSEEYKQKQKMLGILKASYKVAPNLAFFESLSIEIEVLKTKLKKIDLDLSNNTKQISLNALSSSKNKTKQTLELASIELNKKRINDAILYKNRVKKIETKLERLQSNLQEALNDNELKKQENIEITNALNETITKLEKLRKILALEQNINKKYSIEGMKAEQTVLETLKRGRKLKQSTLNERKEKIIPQINQIKEEIDQIATEIMLAKQNLNEIYGTDLSIEECLAKCSQEYIEIREAGKTYKELIDKQLLTQKQIAEYGGALLESDSDLETFNRSVLESINEIEKLNERYDKAIFNREKFFGQNLITFIKNEQEPGNECPICSQLITEKPEHQVSVSLNKFDFEIQSLSHRITEATKTKEEAIKKEAETKQNIIFIKAEVKRLKEENYKLQNAIILIEKDYPQFKGSASSKIDKLIEIAFNANENLANLVYTITNANIITNDKQCKLARLNTELESIEQSLQEYTNEEEIISKILAEHNIEILDYEEEENLKQIDINEVLMALCEKLNEKEKISEQYLASCGKVETIKYQIESLTNEKIDLEQKISNVKCSDTLQNELKFLSKQEFEIKFNLSKQADFEEELKKDEAKLKLEKANLLTSLTFKQNEAKIVEKQINDALFVAKVNKEEIIKDVKIETIELMEQSINKYEIDLRETTINLENITAELKDRKYRNVSIKELESALEKIQRQHVDALKKIDWLKEKIEEDNRIKLKASKLDDEKKELYIQISAQKELQKAIQNGKLLKFITEEYILNITEKANEIFALLTSGRYQFLYDDNFYICDNLSGGSVRSINTLSGGETFLASVSLAIAITEFMSTFKNRPVEFMFLDEGFGTLDRDSLEMVMLALRRLKTNSFTIGVISHEEVVKNKIARKIEIEKANNFEGSKIKMVL